MRALAFTDRPDWGQVRVSQPARTLSTNNEGFSYAAAPYPDAGASDSTWNWTSDVWSTYNPINHGSSAKIWIVDTGILPDHQEFVVGGRSRVTSIRDFVAVSTNGTDCNGHGSHCAGSAAGNFRGVARGADIGNVRVLNCQGSGTSANVIAGYNYVASEHQASGGNDILSASLGGGASQVNDDAINSAVDVGVIAVVAAGNDNANACNYSPARATKAIAVGATQGLASTSDIQTDTRATFSNFGTCVAVFSPGVSIHSAWFTSATTYNTISGTSMATPLAAGAIALFVDKNGKGTTAAVVKDAISKFGVQNVVGNAGAGSPNIFINANWA
jgi:serine protease